MPDHPNLLFVFGDQWRGQATGYAGDPNVKTPSIDCFAAESVVFTGAVSGCPVCSPWRASLMTGQYPHRHGMVTNDQCLAELCEGPFLAEVLGSAGYHTAYIGKWHLAGHGRARYVPPERRLGFETWLGYECNHDYWKGFYYAEGEESRPWEGYDARAQTDAACRIIRERGAERPLALFLSWGPPHAPYLTAPEEYRAMYAPEDIILRGNVPPEAEADARRDLAGYYAHCTALDECFGDLLAALGEAGMADDTVVVFTSDHGDMLGSRGQWKKQRPYEESISVPLVIRDPGASGHRETRTVVDTPDLMPTLLALLGVGAPAEVQGRDLSGALRDGGPALAGDALIASYLPFHQWKRSDGGREYRGLRTEAHTYARDLAGPWLLFDNDADPLQQSNLAADPDCAGLVERLDARLTRRLAELGDDFLPAAEYVERFRIRLDEDGDVFYE